jgi:hypothetical protein
MRRSNPGAISTTGNVSITSDKLCGRNLPESKVKVFGRLNDRRLPNTNLATVQHRLAMTVRKGLRLLAPDHRQFGLNASVPGPMRVFVGFLQG